MPILGAHMSVAGGYYKAVEAAAKIGCDCLQIFTKNNSRWAAKPLTDDDANRFQSALMDHEISHPLSHASYLINLASPKEELRQKSIAAMIVELERANQLGIPFVVFHPGSYTTSSEQEGLDAIVDSLNRIHRETVSLTTIPLLENTAGQGSNLGFEFGQLAYLIDHVDVSERVGICIDTCHTFAAGYPLGTRREFDGTLDEMESSFGLDKIKAIHLNDSKKPFGSRRDRHEHIGEGEMGLEPFRLLLNEPRLAHIPMYLETEKGERNGVDLDLMNLEVLRSLVETR